MKIFFSDYDVDIHVSADEPREVKLNEALAEFESLPEIEGCFFGVIDEQDRVIQFIYNADGRLDVDIPLEERQGSLCKKGVSVDECRKLVIDCEKGVRIDAISGLEFQPW